MHISKQDKDTMLLTSSTSDTVFVVTYNFCLRQRMKLFAEKYPEHYRCVKCTKEGCATFRVSKSCVNVKFTEPIE